MHLTAAGERAGLPAGGCGGRLALPGTTKSKGIIDFECRKKAVIRKIKLNQSKFK